MNGAVLLGQVSAGEAADFYSDNLASAWRFPANRSGNVRVLWAQHKVANPTLTVYELGLFDDDPAGPNPNNLLGKATCLLAEARSDRAFSAFLAASIAVVAASFYWIALRGAGETVDFLGDPGSYLSYNNTGTFANPWNPALDTVGAFQIAAWAEEAPPVTGCDYRTRSPKRRLRLAA